MCKVKSLGKTRQTPPDNKMTQTQTSQLPYLCFNSEPWNMHYHPGEIPKCWTTQTNQEQHKVQGQVVSTQIKQ